MTRPRNHSNYYDFVCTGADVNQEGAAPAHDWHISRGSRYALLETPPGRSARSAGCGVGGQHRRNIRARRLAERAHPSRGSFRLAGTPLIDVPVVRGGAGRADVKYESTASQHGQICRGGFVPPCWNTPLTDVHVVQGAARAAQAATKSAPPRNFVYVLAGCSALLSTPSGLKKWS